MTNFWVKPSAYIMTMHDLVSKGVLSFDMSFLLSQCVKKGASVAVYGNSKSGKSAFGAAVVSSCLPGMVVSTLSSVDLTAQGLVKTTAGSDDAGKSLLLVDGLPSDFSAADFSDTKQGVFIFDTTDEHTAKKSLAEFGVSDVVWVKLVKKAVLVGGRKLERRFVQSITIGANVVCESFLDPWGKVVFGEASSDVSLTSKDIISLGEGPEGVLGVTMKDLSMHMLVAGSPYCTMPVVKKLFDGAVAAADNVVVLDLVENSSLPSFLNFAASDMHSLENILHHLKGQDLAFLLEALLSDAAYHRSLVHRTLNALIFLLEKAGEAFTLEALSALLIQQHNPRLDQVEMKRLLALALDRHSDFSKNDVAVLYTPSKDEAVAFANFIGELQSAMLDTVSTLNIKNSKPLIPLNCVSNSAGVDFIALNSAATLEIVDSIKDGLNIFEAIFPDHALKNVVLFVHFDARWSFPSEFLSRARANGVKIVLVTSDIPSSYLTNNVSTSVIFSQQEGCKLAAAILGEVKVDVFRVKTQDGVEVERYKESSEYVPVADFRELKSLPEGMAWFKTMGNVAVLGDFS